MISERYWPYSDLSASKRNDGIRSTHRDDASQLAPETCTRLHDNLGTSLRCAARVTIVWEFRCEEIHRVLPWLPFEKLCVLLERLRRQSGTFLCLEDDIGVCVEDAEAGAERIRCVVELVCEPVASLRLFHHIRLSSAQCIFYPFHFLRPRIEQYVDAIHIHW